jgi:hypothetical protein
MENQPKNLRTNSTKDSGQGYEIEKNRMDYEGGNQGKDKTTGKKNNKDRNSKNKSFDPNPNSSQKTSRKQ